jgi:hypothetical protein
MKMKLRTGKKCIPGLFCVENFALRDNRAVDDNRLYVRIVFPPQRGLRLAEAQQTDRA